MKVTDKPEYCGDTMEPIEMPEELSKHSIRKTVWSYLQKEKLVNFPYNCWGRIPNFIEAAEASTKATELDAFKNANVVKVNPDKPQENLRIAVLENNKKLVVPIPRLHAGFLKLLVPEEMTNKVLKLAVRRSGIEEHGHIVGLDSNINVDLLVVGSVAVSKEGYRIGKGEGFADLEFAMLRHMKAVSQDTIVVTTVHDCQVFDTLPKELFKPHDVPVDIIVTPTQVIFIQNSLPKPTEIIWNLLSQRRLNLMPILVEMREIDKTAGKDVTLKEEDTDDETQRLYRPRYHKRRRFLKRRSRSDTKNSESQTRDETNTEGEPSATEQPQKRRARKPRFSRKSGSEGPTTDKENIIEGKRERSKKKFHRNRSTIDFSLRIGNIERSVRVRDLKAALAERGVKPNEIIWKGYKGFCYLNFAKLSKVDNVEQQDNAIGVDNIIESLQDLKLTPDSEKSLIIEPAKPISRIETVDVTAV